ncbi:peptidase S9 prolyl oligopeptidase active site domain protein [Fibrella aestuarina BUZ 2]|uniref:Peptidase S9 prolyl oligopeptidase active site domain protein n=1 Tax=Fibrella aestuarina BUZ 2 TaxID=1166018 RepID=I0KGV7_9BACT|nr:prolyl oligopeptidase family serine peptidase [Fibrella aestuarina]CCH03360.1 peptidase S9 prolyl oligopeptidase active site domain protein [Fibrella aestuarina BUZ 2]
MKHLFNLLSWCACALPVLAQPTPPTPTSTSALSIETIMQDPRQWVGTSPSGVFWSDDSRTIYFTWHDARSADKALGDSLYKITLPAPGTAGRNAAIPAPVKVSIAERRLLPSADDRPIYNRARTLRLYEKYGDIFLLNRQTGPSGAQVRMLTSTVERESNPVFSGDEKAVIFTRAQNLFRLDLTTGFVEQLTNFDPAAKKPEAKQTDQESWLKKDQLALFDVLRLRKAKRDETERTTKAEQPHRPKTIGTDGRTVMNASLSPDGRLVTYNLMRSASSKSTIVPNFITESGFTEDLPARTKVGAPLAAVEFMVYDVRRDTALTISLASLPGITDKPDYLMPAAVTSGSATAAGRSTVAASEKTAKDTTTTRKGATTKPANRPVYVSMPVWAEGPTARYGVVSIRALDNKDRWLMLVDTESPTTMKLLDRQRDEAWVGGPGIGGAFSPGTLGWLDAQTIYYQSEADGYSHLYTQNVLTGQKTQLTKGRFEVQQVTLSADKRFFYLTTNERHPGEQHLYRLAVTSGRDGALQRTQLTTMTGANDVTLSPDESRMVIRYSASNKPWELYLLDGIKKKGTEPVAFGGSAIQLTQSTTASFQAYPWREPAVVTIQARDGQPIYARLYQPAANAAVKATGKAVVFVHGAGYLQNAHKWWSQYFREYMFHNLLVDKGYTVLDIDYRASAGYGRDWRTGIYRFMGGKDLTDHVDAAAWLVKNHGVDAKRIGIYGGSYGGFITLMAMFTTPDVFKAGAALRPVTDWAAYNHGYTSNILNEPYADTLAYRRSSPIYHAAGLKGHLLICHGMVDVNVHFQDAVRLAQRLIELKKENWELAAYPVEDHGFVEPTSWMDEYKRILKLFDERL